jgi:hypothetical protein
LSRPHKPRLDPANPLAPSRGSQYYCSGMSKTTLEVSDFPAALAALKHAEELDAQAAEQRNAAVKFFQVFSGMISGHNPGSHTPPPKNGSPETPPTIKHRLIAIAKEAKRPLMPKGFAEEYERRKWPKPKSRKVLSDALSSPISQLAKENTFERVADGYIFAGSNNEVQEQEET